MLKHQQIFLNIIFVIFLILAIILISPIFTPILLGVIFSAIFYPLYKKISLKLKSENGSASITTILVLLIIIIPIIILITGLTKEAFNIANKIGGSEWENNWQTIIEGKNFLANWTDTLSSKFNIDFNSLLKNGAADIVKKISIFLYEGLNSIISNIPKFLLGIFIMALSIFYGLRDGDKLKKALIKISPLDENDEIIIFSKLKEVSRAIFYGNLVSAAAQGFLGGLGFFIFGLGSPVLWGTIMAFLALIPVLGPFLIFIPAAIWMWLTGGNIGIIIVFLVYNIVLVSGVDNILRPIFIGNKIKTHSFLVILSVLGGLSLFGLWGIIYGPVILVTFLTLAGLYLKNNNRGII